MARAPIGVGHGRAQVLTSPPARRTVDTKGIAQRKANQQAEASQQKALDKIMDVDFDLGWQPHDNLIQEQIDNYRNKIVGWSKEGGDMTDPDFQRVVKQEQDKIGLYARKSNEDKELFNIARKEIKSDNRFNEEALNNLHRTINDYDDDGNRTGVRDAFNISGEDMEAVKNDSSNYNMLNVWDTAFKAFPDKTEKVFHEYNPHLSGIASQKDVTSWRGKLFKVIGEGKNQKSVIDIDAADPNDLSKKVLMEDPFVRNYVEQQREAGVDEAKIWEQPIKILEAGLGEQKTTTSKNIPSRFDSGLSAKNFDNAMKYKEEVTRVVGGEPEFMLRGGIAKDVKRMRGDDLTGVENYNNFVEEPDETTTYDVLYKSNGEVLDIIDYSNMDEAREKIGGYLKFRQAPTASELDKTPPYVPEGQNVDDLARSEWLYTDPRQFDLTEEEGAALTTRKEDTLIETSKKNLGKGDKGAEELTNALKGKKYKGKTVSKVEKRTIAKSGWQEIHFTDGSMIVIGGAKGDEDVIDEIIRGGAAPPVAELKPGSLD